MTNPTSNFGWQMPTSTDLVTDLPADFEVFGQAVDTSLADLKGGTTGQILAKATNTDMDFTWVTNDVGDITAVTAGTGISGGGTTGAVTITNDMATTITTNGDLLYGTGSGTYTRRGIGSTGQVLTVSGGVPTWSTPAGGGGKVLQVVQGVTTTETVIASTTLTDTTITATITPTASTSKILVLVMAQSTQYRAADATYTAATLFRGATAIVEYPSDKFGGITVASSPSEINFRRLTSINYLDSPATTSATTYKVQSAAHNTSSSGSVRYQTGSTPSTIILMEIGA
jgi:hypothetical protein